MSTRRKTWILKLVDGGLSAEMEITAPTIDAAIACAREGPWKGGFIYSVTTKRPKPTDLAPEVER